MLATVRSVTKRVTRNRRTMVNVNVGDGSGRMDVVFFNQPWRERQLREGCRSRCSARPTSTAGGLQMSNPVVDLIGDRTGRIVPIYPQSEKAQINTWEIAGWVEEALRRCRERGIADPVPSARSCNVSACSAASMRCRTSTSPSRSATRSRPVAGSPSTNCCGCSWCSCCASERWNEISAASPTTSAGDLVQRFHRCAAVPADRRAAACDRRDRARPGRAASDAPAAAGRRRLGQDRGGRRHDDGGGAGRSPGGADGADRGARRAARDRGAGAARGRERSRSRQPVR